MRDVTMSFTQKLITTQFNLANGQLEGGGNAYLARGLAGARISSIGGATQARSLSPFAACRCVS
jgi:hypothetical protein